MFHLRFPNSKSNLSKFKFIALQQSNPGLDSRLGAIHWKRIYSFSFIFIKETKQS